jgi:Domain of unknown function (DUF5666)
MRERLGDAMKTGFLSLCALGVAFTVTATAQAPNSRPPMQGQSGGFSAMMGRGAVGTVTEAASDHYTIKTETGETYTVHFSVNTRIVKSPPQPAGARGRDRSGQDGMAQDRGAGGNPPQPIKSTDIKVGNVIMASGEMDEAAKSGGAIFVVQFDAESVKRMREMQASFGKTWLAGRVIAVNDTKVTLRGSLDKASHSFVADENTTFRKHRDPITLADIQAGDNVRVEGAIKDGVFVAASVNVMVPQAGDGQSPQ